MNWNLSCTSPSAPTVPADFANYTFEWVVNDEVLMSESFVRNDQESFDLISTISEEDLSSYLYIEKVSSICFADQKMIIIVHLLSFTCMADVCLMF